jgi:ribosomal protein L7/L12
VKAKISQLLQDGKKIEAIKLCRETYNTGLKRSKEAVEQFESSGVLPIPSLNNRW